jgi:hypothetical protein
MNSNPSGVSSDALLFFPLPPGYHEEKENPEIKTLSISPKFWVGVNTHTA